MKATFLLTFSLFALLAVGVFTQRVDPNTVTTKSFWCSTLLGFDYHTVTDAVTGVVWVDRNFYRRRMYDGSWLVRPCAPGVWFSVRSDCICDTRIPNPDFGNTARCTTITGNPQLRAAFTRRQRGQTSQALTAWVDGFENTVPILNDNCIGTNNTHYRSLPVFKGDSIAREDLDISVGFRIPPTFLPTSGREYQLVSTSPCTDDPNRSGSLIIAYIAGGVVNNVQIRPQISVTLELSSRFDVTGTMAGIETNVRLTCQIPNEIQHPSNTPLNPRNSYFWDQTSAGNYVRLTLSQNNLGTTRISLFNQQMANNNVNDQTEVPANGFCVTQAGPTFLGSLGSAYQIAPRDCSLRLGLAPQDLYVCLTSFSLTRDCAGVLP